MKQLVQQLGSGEPTVTELPAPQASARQVLIRNSRSLVSAGTERMLVEFGRAGWPERARQQPERVLEVLDKVRTDGLAATYQAVTAKLDQPIPLGYRSAGVVLEIGAGVQGFSVGDRVASNGPHAEIVSVPHNLCALIPGNLSDESAAFTVVGAIAPQGVRLAQPTLGGRFAVIGLGLIGLLTVQLPRAHSGHAQTAYPQRELTARARADAVPGTQPHSDVPCKGSVQRRERR